jgi:hypothetical protein
MTGSAAAPRWKSRMPSLLGIRRPRRSGRVAMVAAITLGAGNLALVAWPRGASPQEELPAEQVFDLRIEGGELADGARSLRVTQGDSVRLRWTTDAPVILHLHGYDVEQEVAPGKVTEMHLEAHATGRFPLEVHASDPAHHEAPLLVLEVYPR